MAFSWNICCVNYVIYHLLRKSFRQLDCKRYVIVDLFTLYIHIAKCNVVFVCVTIYLTENEAYCNPLVILDNWNVKFVPCFIKKKYWLLKFIYWRTIITARNSLNSRYYMTKKYIVKRKHVLKIITLQNLGCFNRKLHESYMTRE